MFHLKKNNLGNSIIKSTLFISIFTIFSKVLGLVKQVVISSIGGASLETDAYSISTGIFGQIVTLIFSAVSVSALTLYVEIKEKKGKTEASNFIKTLLMTLVPFSIILAIIVFLLSDQFATFLASSNDLNYIRLLSKYIKIMSISFVPWGIYLTLNIILESEKKFIPGRCQAFFQNIFIILACLFFYKKIGAVSLVIAFVLSGIVECVYIISRTHNEIRNASISTAELFNIKKMVIIAIPLIIGNASSELNDIVDKKIASSIGEGVPTLLNYSATLNEIITGVVISSLSVVLFTHFADMIAKNDIQKVEHTLKKTILYLLIFLLPITIIFLVYGDTIVRIMFGHGAITEDNINSIYMILIGYSVGFIFQAIRIIYAKAIYAFKDTKAPMLNGFISICVNIFLSYYLASKIGVMGISLSTSLSMLLASVLLHKSLKKYLPNLSYSSEKVDIIKIVFSSVICLGVAVLFKYFYLGKNIVMPIIFSMLCLLIYIIMLNILKIKLIDEIKLKIITLCNTRKNK